MRTVNHLRARSNLAQCALDQLSGGLESYRRTVIALIAFAIAVTCLAVTPPKTASAAGNYGNYGDLLLSGATWAPEWAGLGDLNVYSNGPTLAVVGPTGTYGIKYQCTELAERFASVVYGMGDHSSWSAASSGGVPWNGAAYDMWRVAPALGFVQHPNGGADGPQRGDLLVFDYRNSQLQWLDNVGHVAVVTGNSNGTVTFVDQNGGPDWGKNSLPIGGTYMPDSSWYMGARILGWLRAPRHTDLWFVKTIHTGNGHVEVHSATAATGYTSGIHAATWFSSADANNGTWQMVGQDLFFIKEINTGGHVEVHSATAASGYQIGIHAVTRFSPADAFNGIWEMVGQDLYFIKIRNTGSGRVEVHSATAASGYASGIDRTTWFSQGDAYNGVWQMVGPDLYFIKTRNTGGGRVEVHSATVATGYGSGLHAATWFSSGDANNGTWQMVGQDLFFVKEINTGTGHVEVHSATASTGYRSGIHSATWFSSADAYNGAWQVGNRS